MIAQGGTFTVTPDVGLILWPLLIWAFVVAVVVTALKGQWRWLILGAFFPPLLLVSAFLPAEPDSVLGRRKARRGLTA